MYRPAVHLPLPLPLLPPSVSVPPFHPTAKSGLRRDWKMGRESIATVIRILRSGGRGHVGSTAMGVQHYSHTISTMPSASLSRCFLEYLYPGDRVASKWIAVASGRIGLHSRPRPPTPPPSSASLTGRHHPRAENPGGRLPPRSFCQASPKLFGFSSHEVADCVRTYTQYYILTSWRLTGEGAWDPYQGQPGKVGEYHHQSSLCLRTGAILVARRA